MAAEQHKEPLKMTLYLPAALVDALDRLKVKDQQAGKVKRNLNRPPYLAWALEQYALQRGEKIDPLVALPSVPEVPAKNQAKKRR